MYTNNSLITQLLQDADRGYVTTVNAYAAKKAIKYPLVAFFELLEGR